MIPKTLLQFEDMVRNRTIPDVLGYYRLTIWRYSSDCKGNYSFKYEDASFRIPVGEYTTLGYIPETGYYTTIENALVDIIKLAEQPDIISFEIRKYPFENVSNEPYFLEAWMYDSHGKFIQEASCSALHYHAKGIFGKFFGHFIYNLPYNVGDPVVIITREGKNKSLFATLGVVVEIPQTIKEGYNYYRSAIEKWIESGNSPESWVDIEDYPGSDDDEYFILTGPIDEHMEKLLFLHPMSIMPAPINLPEKTKSNLRAWYSMYCNFVKNKS